jgi:hypothetical protein
LQNAIHLITFIVIKENKVQKIGQKCVNAGHKYNYKNSTFKNVLSICNIRVILQIQIPPCGGGLEYLHRSPASRIRRRKGNPVPGNITGPLGHWGTYRYIKEPGPPGWGLAARLMTLLCKKIIVAKSKEVKAGWST